MVVLVQGGSLPHVALANVFGQTETLGAYTTLMPDDHHDPARAGSVGRPLPGVEVRVVDPETGNDVNPGAIGELWVNTTQNVTEGWLRTGDLARQDADGYIFPSGRLSDTINRGGEKFGPIEVEEALRSHPAVSDVAVAGVMPKLGDGRFHGDRAGSLRDPFGHRWMLATHTEDISDEEMQRRMQEAMAT